MSSQINLRDSKPAERATTAMDDQMNELANPGTKPTANALEMLKAKLTGLTKKVKKVGEDDPRRMIHSLKAGLALTLVSLFYYVSPLFDGLGVSAMWAIVTVVVVMEYTVGGTLSKGLNRAFATFVAGALGLGAHHVAVLFGATAEPVILGVFVFVLASAATYSRFIPEIKARYDYGACIFIMTFSLVTVSSYRTEQLVQFAEQRATTIAIGVAICLFTTIFVFPVWAGTDLHKLVATNLEKLANFMEGLGAEFSEKNASLDQVFENKTFVQACKGVINSKATEESMANLARWEPAHGPFRFGHPWKQYLKIGTLCRQSAYTMEALVFLITTNHDKTFMGMETPDPELQERVLSPCAKMSSECSKALRELAIAVRTMKMPSVANQHIAAAAAVDISFMSALSSDESIRVRNPHVAILGFFLVQLVQCIEQVATAVEELAQLARFRNWEPELPDHNKASVLHAKGREHDQVSMDVERGNVQA